MAEPFSVRVSSPGWRAEAEQWIRAAAETRGIRLTGAIAQPRVRPWSTQLTIETDAGRLWFKANAPPFAFEGPLQRELAAIAPWALDAPLAVAADRGWMLTAEHAPPLGDTAPPTTAEWATLLVEAARLQQELLPHRDRLRGTGLPDRTPATVPALFDALRARLREYPSEHPGHLAPSDDLRLGRARAHLVDAAQRIAADGLPDTWNHGDLHAFNAYRDGDRLRLFDLGDGSWANALEVLAVPAEWLAGRDATPGAAVDWNEVVAAYLRAWGASPLSDAMWRDIRLLHAVNRAQVWAAWLDDTTPDELERYGRQPEEHLTSVLDILEMREGSGGG